MFEDLKIKTLVRKVANDYSLSYDDKVLMYINIFENEPKKQHTLIKQYINEFSPMIWQEFNEYLTIKNMTNIIKKSTDEKTSLDDIMKKLNKED